MTGGEDDRHLQTVTFVKVPLIVDRSVAHVNDKQDWRALTGTRRAARIRKKQDDEEYNLLGPGEAQRQRQAVLLNHRNRKDQPNAYQANHNSRQLQQVQPVPQEQRLASLGMSRHTTLPPN